MNNARLLPLVIGGVSALLALKILALALDEGRLAGIPAALADGGQASGDVAAQAEAGEDNGNAPARSRSRDALLESLVERREELDERENELDMREKLLEATRARVEERIVELREIEGRIDAAITAEEEARRERFENLVAMYESMKARDAAGIFNGLDMPTLVRVAEEMNPRNMSEILAAMDPDVAQRLTLELTAEESEPVAPDENDELPKITGTAGDL